MSQKTIVALYGQKPEPLAELLKTLQQKLCGIEALDFQPYHLQQIHATLIGLEEDPATSGLNRNFKLKRQVERQMDILGFRQYLKSSSEFPLQIQIGGFTNRDYPFTSRDMRPYHRSFSIQGDFAVIMGWAIRGIPSEADVRYPLTLDNLRRNAQRFGVLHAYHVRPTDVDNDFYMRLGLLGNVPSASQREEIEKTLRDFLSTLPPLVVNLELADFSVVSYDDETLPWGETQSEPV
jgi:hypothetical protein